MSDSPVRDLVVNIVKEYLGQELTTELGIEIASRITQGVLMTRQGTGLPGKPGQSVQFSQNERRGDIEQPEEEEANEEPPKKTRTVAIVSMPYDDVTKPADQQDGSRPIRIQKEE